MLGLSSIFFFFSSTTHAIVHNNSNVLIFAILEYKSPFLRNLTLHMQCNSGQGPVTRKFQKACGPEKSSVKLQPALSVKLVFLHVVKGTKIKLTAKFRASGRLRFKDAKKIVTRSASEESSGLWRNGPQQSRTTNNASSVRILYLEVFIS